MQFAHARRRCKPPAVLDNDFEVGRSMGMGIKGRQSAGNKRYIFVCKLGECLCEVNEGKHAVLLSFKTSYIVIEFDPDTLVVDPAFSGRPDWMRR